MNQKQLDVIKEEYNNMNWEDFRENAGDLITREIEIYNTVVIEGVPALLAEVERLREALGYYADEDNYEPITIEAGIPQGDGTYKEIKRIVPQSEYVIRDKGEIARNALKGGE